jgi:hypothetical protein
MNKLLRRSKMFLNRNSATILTCVGGVGVVATSVLAVKATPKALFLLENAEEEKGEKLTKLEKVKIAGPAYIPAIMTGAATLACIFGANALNKRQQASLMSAYALLDSSYKEHKAKVEELYGEGANDRVTAEIAKDKYEEADITVEDGKQLFYDEFSGRYFESTIEAVQRAEYYLNRDVAMQGYAYLNDFYDYLDIEPVDGGDAIGWSEGANLACYWQSWIDFTHKKVLIDDDLECRVIVMLCEPLSDFMDYS